MKRTLFALSLLAAAFAAQATQPAPTPTPTTTNNPQAYGGLGLGVGIAAAAARSQSAAQAAGGAASAQGGQGIGGAGGSAMGGAGGLGGTVGNVQAGGLDMAGASIGAVERSAPPAYAPPGSAPRLSCRLFAGLGGSNTSGALSGGIPIGNDQICVTGAQFELMDRINQHRPATFSQDDYLRAACKVEGMGDTGACQRIQSADTKRARADASTVSASLLP